MHWTMAFATTLFSYLKAANKPLAPDRGVESVPKGLFCMDRPCGASRI